MYEDRGMKLVETDAEGVMVVEAHGRLDSTTSKARFALAPTSRIGELSDVGRTNPLLHGAT